MKDPDGWKNAWPARAKNAAKVEYRIETLDLELRPTWTMWETTRQERVRRMHAKHTPNGDEVLQRVFAGETVKTSVEGVVREFRRSSNP